MIHEEICTYEVCKLAKEKGFNVQTFDWYDYTGNYHKGFIPRKLHECPQYKESYALTQSLLQRWLREEKKIVVEVGYYSVEKKYYWSVFDTTKDDMFASFIPPSRSMSRYDTWEQALESGLKYALKELK